jgi:hypothetical protein
MKQEAMLAGFDAFTNRIFKRYGEVRDCLATGRYEEAHVLLTAIAITHAKTSLSLRNVLIKDGKMEDNP